MSVPKAKPSADRAQVTVMSMNVLNVMRHAVLATLAASLLSSCAAWDRVKDIGQQPALSSVDNPTTRPGYKPELVRMPAEQPAPYSPTAMWPYGSRAVS